MTSQIIAQAILFLAPLAETPSVADALAASRRAHINYQSAKPRQTPSGPTSGDPVAATDALKVAASNRAYAERQDPSHADGAWRGDPTPTVHDELLEFYLQQLTK